jgi:hypothetical protein
VVVAVVAVRVVEMTRDDVVDVVVVLHGLVAASRSVDVIRIVPRAGVAVRVAAGRRMNVIHVR